MTRSPIAFYLDAVTLFLALGLLISGVVPALAASENVFDVSGGTRIVYNTTNGTATPELTVDVFWCADDGKAAGRSLAASEIAATWGVLAKVDTGKPKLPTVVVRTRPIDLEAFRKSVSPEDFDRAKKNALMRYDDTDNNSKIFVDRIVFNQRNSPTTLPAQHVTLIKNIAFTPGYVSAFVCTEVDIASVSGRLFFQVKYPTQKREALAAAAVLSKELPGLTVIKDVEVVGEKAPINSEVRYFYETDARLAELTAESISASTSTRVEVKRVPGYESRVRRGTLEAWIASQR